MNNSKRNNMKKQTAVEWLALYIKGITNINCDEVIDHALAMEKENSEISFFAGYNYEGGHPIDEHEDYYTETYGN
jgi:hypothetical protein